MGWRKEEGTYRDDITCIVVFLPILPDEPDKVAEANPAPERLVKAVSDDEQIDGGDANHFVERRLTLSSQPSDTELQQLAELCSDNDAGWQHSAPANAPASK